MSQFDRFTRKRWMILVLYGVINLCVGSLYAWSVFAGPLQEQLGAANLSMVYTLSTSIGPIPMIIGGALTRKLGIRKLLVLSGVIFGAGMLLSGFVTDVGQLTLSYGIGAGLGAALAYGCTVGGSVKLFPDRRGLAGGVAAATYGGSAVLIPPIANSLIGLWGVMTTLKLLGAVSIVLICVCALFVEECPEGFVPSGWTPPEEVSLSEGKNWREMLSTPVFYVMLLLLLCGAVSGLMTISQASAMAQKLVDMTAAAAAIIVSVLSAFNAAGRILSGALSDRIGRINTLTIMLCLSLMGIVLLAVSHTVGVWVFCIGIAAIGVGFGSFLGVFPGFTADRFGQKHQSVNYGVMFIGFSLAGLIGPSVASAVYLSSGNYNTAFLIAGGLCAAGLVLTVAYRRMKQS